MRKPADIDAQIQALQDKAKSLKERQKTQLGELVLATITTAPVTGYPRWFSRSGYRRPGERRRHTGNRENVGAEA